MSQAPFPGHGQGGNEPRPVSGTGNGTPDTGYASQGAGETREAAGATDATRPAYAGHVSRDTARTTDTDGTGDTPSTPDAAADSRHARQDTARTPDTDETRDTPSTLDPAADNEGGCREAADASRPAHAGHIPQYADGTGDRASTPDAAVGNVHACREADDDFDLDAAVDRLVADADAGRIQVPPPEPAEQGLTVSLAEITGPDAATVAGLAGPGVAGFAQGGPADTMAPGAVLTALAETACAPAALPGLDDNQVLGLAAAGKRIAALGAWVELTAASQFAGRRRTGDPPGTVAGENLAEFAGDELAPELGMTPFAAAQHLGYARDVARRLPDTFAALRAGRVDGYRVKIVAEATQWLSDDDAAEADRVLAVSAAQLTYGRLRNAAARLVLMLDPETARRRKDAAASNARVMCFREEAGTAGLSGRDLPSAETLASWSHVKARAAAYRAAGMAGTITELRSRAFLDLLQEHDARDALGAPDHSASRHDEADDEDGNGGTDTDGTGPGGGGTDGGGGTGPRPAPGGPAGPGGAARTPAAAPVAALINITVTDGTLAGTSQAPGEVAGFGLMDAEDIRDLAATASAHPATRWCVTVIGPDGTARAHGCAPGRHPYHPGQDPAGAGSSENRDGPAHSRDGPARNRDQTAGNRGGPAHNRDGPAPDHNGPARNQHRTAGDQNGPPEPRDSEQAAEFLRRLRVELAPIAKGKCDHASYEPGYRPSRKLRHLIRARTVRCHFRGCSQPAADCDADHTVPWPAGPTCQCNLGPPCRHHHRCKQDPGWKLEQPEPGVMVWTGPSGRRHTTRPTTYP